MISKISLALSVLALALAVFAFFYHRVSIASFDVNATVYEFEAQLTQDHLTEAQSKYQFARFNSAMTQAEHDYSNQNHVGLIVSQAAVTNIKDVTKDIQLRIQALMLKQNNN